MGDLAALAGEVAAIEQQLRQERGSYSDVLASIQRQDSPAPPRQDAAARAADLKARQAIELEEIRQGLRNSTDSLVALLIQEKPTSTSGPDWRYGPKGGFKVTMRGAKRGLWHDHGRGTGGDMLALIQDRQSLSFVQAVAWARDYLGLPTPQFGRALTDAERAEARRRLEQAEAIRLRQVAEHEARVALRHETVASRAGRVWKGSPPAPPDHPYLAAKGIQPNGARLDRRSRLRLPLRDAAGRIWSLQHIQALPGGGSAKRFLRRGRAEGMFTVLGDLGSGRPLPFAEGFATGASIHEATGLPVVVCYSVGNKERVMTAWRAREPDRMLIDAADNDHAKPLQDPPMPNAGAVMAAKLAQAIGAVPALPPFLPTEAGSDWNDFARLHGLAAVRESLRDAVRRARDARRAGSGSSGGAGRAMPR